ncbi:MAG: hypothetical protein ACOX5G_00680 [Kiritimatiellia bacterium]|jgi:hypothetical protein
MSTIQFKQLIARMLLMSFSLLSYGQELQSLQELIREATPELPGAKVPNGNDASRIAQKAYVEKMRSLSAFEGWMQPKLVELGFEINDFAEVGDAVWEVRFTNLNSKGHQALRAVLWVHAETKVVHFVCGPWDTAGKAAKPLQIEGTKVSAQADAKRIAFEAYAKKMRAEVLANEGVQDISVVTLGYDVPGFATEGERIWEARVLTIEGKLRAIIWVNPRSEDVHFVCGSWEEKTSE